MNEQTATLLQQLAAKLGTTSEDLWAVLIKQAPIAGSTQAFQYACTLLAIYLMVKFRKQLTAACVAIADEAEPLAFILAIVFICVSVVWLVSCLLAFDDMVTAFLNPEFWAFQKVLSAFNSK